MKLGQMTCEVDGAGRTEHAAMAAWAMALVAQGKGG